MDDHLELLLNGQQYKKFQELLYKPIVHKYDINVLDMKLLYVAMTRAKKKLYITRVLINHLHSM